MVYLITELVDTLCRSQKILYHLLQNYLTLTLLKGRFYWTISNKIHSFQLNSNLKNVSVILFGAISHIDDLEFILRCFHEYFFA
jgi:hypothetical protein